MWKIFATMIEEILLCIQKNKIKYVKESIENSKKSVYATIHIIYV